MNIWQLFNWKKYLLKQLMDAVLFALYALDVRPALAEQPLELARLAGEWVIQHGTPTRERVVAELGPW